MIRQYVWKRFKLLFLGCVTFNYRTYVMITFWSLVFSLWNNYLARSVISKLCGIRTTCKRWLKWLYTSWIIKGHLLRQVQFALFRFDPFKKQLFSIDLPREIQNRASNALLNFESFVYLFVFLTTFPLSMFPTTCPVSFPFIYYSLERGDEKGRQNMKSKKSFFIFLMLRCQTLFMHAVFALWCVLELVRPFNQWKLF